MRYKVLLTGRAFSVIDDFFVITQGTFECMTTSDRESDLRLHLKLFQPDAIVCCLREESKEKMLNISTARRKAMMNEVPLIIIGNQEDIEEFSLVTNGAQDLALCKPLSITKIQEEILRLFRERERKEAERKALEEQAVEDARKAEEEARLAAEEEKRVLEEQKELEMIERGEIPMKHVLVIDDDPVMLKTIKRYLEGEYSVATALSGKLALKFLEKKETDVVLLDYEMPQLTGPEVLTMLRENEKTKNVPVIFLTGVNEVDKIQNVLKMKPQGYMLKPVNNEELHRTLEKVLK